MKSRSQSVRRSLSDRHEAIVSPIAAHKELKGLLDAGIVSETEYQANREKYVSQLGDVCKMVVGIRTSAR